MSASQVVIASLFYLIGFLFSAIYIAYARRREVCFAKGNCFENLRRRLNAYALMKQPCATVYHPPVSNLKFVPTAMMISHEQHDILLGILKKIETKSAVLVAIVIFTLPVLIGQVGFLKGLVDGVEFPLYVAAGILTAMLISGADGAGHLGQPHYRKHIATMPSRSIWDKELQRKLLEDMLRKEASFSASLRLAVFVMMCFPSSYLLYFWVSRNEIRSEFRPAIQTIFDMFLR